MRELISNNTGKPSDLRLNTDIDILPDGEGGIYLAMCWHEIVELGSVAAHLPSQKVKELLHNINLVIEETEK